MPTLTVTLQGAAAPRRSRLRPARSIVVQREKQDGSSSGPSCMVPLDDSRGRGRMSFLSGSGLSRPRAGACGHDRRASLRANAEGSAS